MQVYVGGVNGAGKTALLSAVHAARPEWRVVHVTKVFMEWLGFGDDYSRLRALSSDLRDRELAACIRSMTQTSSTAPCLYDSHYLNLKAGVIDHVVRDWLSVFDALLLVSCPASLAFERVCRDARVRERGLFPLDMEPTASRELFQNYVQQTRETFISLSARYQLPALEIVNTDLPDAVSQVIAFVEAHSSSLISA